MAAIGPAHVGSAVRSERVFVASSRDGGGKEAAPLSYFSYEVLVPPSHRPGQDLGTTGPGATFWKNIVFAEHRHEATHVFATIVNQPPAFLPL